MKAEVDPAVLHTVLGNGEAVLVHTRTAHYYSLNPTGYRIWSLLAAGLSVEQAGLSLTEEFEVPDRVALAAVERLVEELSREGLLKLVDPDADPRPAA